jgi:hypothetical protein
VSDFHHGLLELLAELNARPMKTYGGLSRRDLFLRFDQPALGALPAERFVYTEWRQATVNIFCGVLPYVTAGAATHDAVSINAQATAT